MLLGDFKFQWHRTEELSIETGCPKGNSALFTNIHNLYNPPKVLPPSSFSDHNDVVYELAKSFRYNAGKSINIKPSQWSKSERKIPHCLS